MHFPQNEVEPSFPATHFDGTEEIFATGDLGETALNDDYVGPAASKIDLCIYCRKREV